MIVTAATPGGLMSACLSAIQAFNRAATQQAGPAAGTAMPALGPPGGATHLPGFTSSAGPADEGAVSRLAVTQAQRAYETTTAGTRLLPAP
ncbi:MAG: hypothetical protein JWP20_1777 [Roseomonas sp.]|nr:hypothetical protein [Roseomonas sp.]